MSYALIFNLKVTLHVKINMQSTSLECHTGFPIISEFGLVFCPLTAMLICTLIYKGEALPVMRPIVMHTKLCTPIVLKHLSLIAVNYSWPKH